MSEQLEILKATFNPENKKIELNINASHIPMLCYCLKLLELQITDKILEAQMGVKNGGIILPDMGVKI
jgi:hypothetical protein